MDEIVATTLSQRRFRMWLFAALAGLAFLLASVGIYSVLSYSVRNRMREIGVRIALGARSTEVIRLVIAEETNAHRHRGRSFRSVRAWRRTLETDPRRERNRLLNVHFRRGAARRCGTRRMRDPGISRDARSTSRSVAERITSEPAS